MNKMGYIWIIGSLLLLAGTLFAFTINSSGSFEEVNNFDDKIIIYKSSSCDCCEVYGNYFKAKGNPNAEIINTEDIDSIKTEYGVPESLRSCHTTIIGDYFVEGHIPLEAVNKLLKEKPDIAGIAMSGMPGGSPGMPGTKLGDFVIYAVNHDGGYKEFMRL